MRHFKFWKVRILPKLNYLNILIAKHFTSNQEIHLLCIKGYFKPNNSLEIMIFNLRQFNI